ncbi:hypothetical protein LINPERHAP1_LOCUS372 [Linum perenne]
MAWNLLPSRGALLPVGAGLSLFFSSFLGLRVRKWPALNSRRFLYGPRALPPMGDPGGVHGYWCLLG